MSKDVPVDIIDPNANYDILKKINRKEAPGALPKPSQGSSQIQRSEINDPGMEIYKAYTKQYQDKLIALHCAFLALKVVALVSVEIFNSAPSSNLDIPFTLHWYFVFITWATLLLLEAVFIVATLKRTLYSTEALGKQMGRLIFLASSLETLYLALRNSYELELLSVVSTVSLAGLSGVLLYIYRRVKYEDDGRYVVNRYEYAGIHVRLSCLVGWVLVTLMHSVFVSLSYSVFYDSDEQTFFGWEDSGWSILVMCLLIATGLIMLTTYRDIFFIIILGYTCFGVYFIHVDKEQGSGYVSMTALVMGIGVLVVSVVSLAYHFRASCYLNWRGGDSVN